MKCSVVSCLVVVFFQKKRVCLCCQTVCCFVDLSSFDSVCCMQQDCDMRFRTEPPEPAAAAAAAFVGIF